MHLQHNHTHHPNNRQARTSLPGETASVGHSDFGPKASPEKTEQLRSTIEENAQNLARLFQLTGEEHTLLVKLALIQNDLPFPGHPSESTYTEILSLLTPTAPLCKFGLVEIEEKKDAMPYLSEKMINRLQGTTDLDRWLVDFIEELPDPLPLPRNRERLSENIAGIAKRAPNEHRILEINGPHPSDLHSLARSVAQKAGMPAYKIRAAHLLRNPVRL